MAVLYIANAFLHADNDENAVMLLRGKLAEMMVRVCSELYQEYIEYSANGVTMLYVQLLRALYGMLKAALQFYKKLRRELEDMGFVINPYDPCVANKMVDGSQMTVCWHVDDLKISHKDKNMMPAFAIKITSIFGDKPTITRWRVHTYLGVELDFDRDPGTMIIFIINYLQTILDEFPEVLRSTKACPAGDHLFKIRPDEERELLGKEMAKQFHRTTAQLLFL